MASNSTWYTETLELITSTDEQHRPVTTTVLSLSPPNDSTASSTWFIVSTKTVEEYVTWISNLSTPVTRTLPEETKTQQDATRPVKSADSSPASPSSSVANEDTTALRSVQSSNGISNGALAGAIVGSIIGTALVTLLLAFLFFRRRNAKPAKQIDDDTFAGAATRHRKSKSKSGAFPLADIIPQPEPADDDTVRRRILTLVDQAGLHIDNYYVPGSTPAHLSSEQSARLAVYNSADLPAPIETLLGQREIRRQAIKYALVRTILRGIIPGGNGNGELLPRAFADMPVVDGSSGSAAVFNWRMLTAHLYSQTQSNTTTHSSSNRNSKTQPSTSITEESPIQATESLAGQFTAAFNPYSFPSFTPEERTSHLETLACSAADLGVWLFSQPCSFEFDWGGSGTAEIRVVPRVLKVADEKGGLLVTPQVLVEGEKVAYTPRA
ncbi:hypothetical protein ASPVEDRAFT_34466 [Aspergillus versicolor CBS 583.65]|uniref:Uncharacterized protein n=1 Tax=Aspergillus versicolor CBS 583.65 TaxID=1036611 RepID=A0A1L9Q3K7_ASPVE|nr:uncharacterized protein ASPVEDRAFT_34466 [Aspergillus versicolor CBS 583.65]OJJ08299.1 hypothetical protein ASPVEDRAFT_34466 [Aspergillus versicolor CBS 583.65]